MWLGLVALGLVLGGLGTIVFVNTRFGYLLMGFNGLT
jgi:hypothetical protein